MGLFSPIMPWARPGSRDPLWSSCASAGQRGRGPRPGPQRKELLPPNDQLADGNSDRVGKRHPDWAPSLSLSLSCSVLAREGAGVAPRISCPGYSHTHPQSAQESLPLAHPPRLRNFLYFFFFTPSGTDPPRRLLGARLTHNIQTASAASCRKAPRPGPTHGHRLPHTVTPPTRSQPGTHGGLPHCPLHSTLLRGHLSPPVNDHPRGALEAGEGARQLLWLAGRLRQAGRSPEPS